MHREASSDLSGLWPKSVTCLLNEQWGDVKAKGCDLRKSVRVYQRMDRAGRMAILQKNHVYVARAAQKQKEGCKGGETKHVRNGQQRDAALVEMHEGGAEEMPQPVDVGSDEEDKWKGGEAASYDGRRCSRCRQHAVVRGRRVQAIRLDSCRMVR